MKYLLLFFSLLFYSSIQSQWVEEYAKITGNFEFDEFGSAMEMSADGMRIIAGGQRNDDNGINSGHARVFELINNEWVQIGQTIVGDTGGDFCGHAVSISDDGSTIAVGFQRNSNEEGFEAGKVNVYNWSGSDWMQIGDEILGQEGSDLFGESVGLSYDGSMLIAGSPGNSDISIGSGHTRVFQFNDNEWIQLGINIDGYVQNGSFGDEVCISDDGETIGISSKGNGKHIEVYDWDNSNWIQRGDDIAPNFGFSIDLSSDGNTLIAGAPSFDLGGDESIGVIRVMQWDGEEWVIRGSSLIGDAAINQLGYSVAISGDGNYIIGGAYQNADGGVNSGHAKVFEWSGSNWSQIGESIAGELSGDYSGGAVAITDDGLQVAIGAYNGTDQEGQRTGYVRIFNSPFVSINELEKIDNVHISPNPVTEKSQLYGIDFNTINKINLYNVTGELENEFLLNLENNSVNYSNLKSGVYFLRIYLTNGNVDVIKFLK